MGSLANGRDFLPKTAWLREQWALQDMAQASDDTPNNSASDQHEQDGESYLLPTWTAVQSTHPPSRNPILIDGVVRCGHVALLSGKGKLGKTWSAIELCVSVATGRKSWFGLPLKSSGRCLFIDPETDSKSLDKRFAAVCNAIGAETALVDSSIAKWSLRGIADANMDAIIHDLELRRETFALVVIDSCSCFLNGEENASIDVRAFAAKVLRIAELTGATVLLVHHFGKSKDGDRAAADRARGSSVFLDFPDAVLTLTETFPPSGEPSDFLGTKEHACILESGGIREFPRLEPVRLIFEYPIHRVDFGGITDGWKPNSSQRDGGRESGKTRQAQAEARKLQGELQIADFFISRGIGADGVPLSEVAREVFGDSRTERTKTIVEDSGLFTIVKPSRNRCNVVAVNPPPLPPPQLDL